LVFLSELPSQITLFEQFKTGAFSHKERQELHILCHRLRGAASFFTLKEISLLATEIEDSAETQDKRELCDKIERLLKLLKKVK